jgi:hypothetical protein
VRSKALISSERRSHLVICRLDDRDCPWRALSPTFSLEVAIALNICSTICAIELEREREEGFRRGPDGVSFLELGMVNGVYMVWRKLFRAACCLIVVASDVSWDERLRCYQGCVVPSFYETVQVSPTIDMYGRPGSLLGNFPERNRWNTFANR